MPDDYDKLILELSGQLADAREKEQKKKIKLKIALLIGKWFADHLIELAALILSIIALINTLRPQ